MVLTHMSVPQMMATAAELLLIRTARSVNTSWVVRWLVFEMKEVGDADG